MKTIARLALLGMVVSFAACTSYVKTYNAEGNLLGICKSGITILKIPLIAGLRSNCVGSANPKDQDGR